MKLAFTTLACPDWPLEEIVRRASGWGYDGVDFRGLLDEVDVTRRPEFTTDLVHTKRLLANHGLRVSCISTSARYAVLEPEERQDQFDETVRNLDLAAALDAPLLRVFAGEMQEGETVDSVFSLVVDGLRRMGEEAAERDVTLGVETHDDWTASALMARLMTEVDHPHVGVVWDLHHPYRMTGESPQETLGLLGPYVVNVHVKDSVPADGGYEYVLVGEGDVPLHEMLARLEEDGYDGYATLEWEKRWHPELAGPEVALPHYVQTMREWGVGAT